MFEEVKNPVSFSDLESKILGFWEKRRIFEKSIASRPEDRPFVFYEGPPTANGKPGIHHVISRSIKDFVCRLKTMQGFRVIRKAGWDTHGLPVEIEVEKELGFESKDQIEAYGIDRFNQKCRESVFKYVREWNELTRRIGYWVDLDHPYITYTNEYIETVWYLLAQIWKKNLLYQGFKILPYCPRCETALSSHETALGYREATDRSLTVKFTLKDRADEYILAWTTTPWTLPGNVALAVGAEIRYARVAQESHGRREIYYLAEDRLSMLKGPFEHLGTLTGLDMEGWTYSPLFDFIDLSDPEHPAYRVATADFVTTEEGTGVVHTAVMYGEDDYRLGMAIGLPAKHTVDEHGRFNERVGPWKGGFVKDPAVEEAIIAYLRSHGALYAEEPYTHAYPHCWRCDSPLLYYAKKSWYIRTTAVKEEMIAQNAQIEWYPKEVGEGRFGQWLENNIDWALSRDRYWGTPLNIWLCGCGAGHAVESIAELKQRSGLDQINDLHKPFIDTVTFPCPSCGSLMERTPEVVDCWFDSGAMPYAQYHYPFAQDGLFERQFPADFIAEGVDQTRGWFYSLLAISTIISGRASYKRCLSIELILDKEGQKMSKSRGNAVDPFQILNQYGADALRWYLFTVSPPWVPTRFDPDGVAEVVRKFLGTLINTYSFFVLYAKVDRFTYCNPIPVEKRPEIDRWLLSVLHGLIARVNRWLDRYDLTRAARAIHDFVIDDLSNWYVRRNRRRFWKSEPGEDKWAAYQTLYECLMTLAKLVAPYVPFVAEEIYLNLNRCEYEPCESVHLCGYPSPSDERYRFRDKLLEERMRLTREVVALCRSARNEAGIRVRQPLSRAVIVTHHVRDREALATFARLIQEEINVHALEFTVDAESLEEKAVRPLFKKLGPKFGSQVNRVAEIIRGFGAEEIAQLEAGQPVHISLDGSKHGEIVSEDVEIFTTAQQGFVVQKGHGFTVALDTRLDEDLVSEGLSREVINRIQNMRKEANFSVIDRIHVWYQAGPVLSRAIRRHRETIAEEVLALSIEEGPVQDGFMKEWEIDQEKITLTIMRHHPRIVS